METYIRKDHRISYLDGWRGLAIILVLIAHFGGFMYNDGTVGVELFFVLSGSLMGKILFIDKISLRTFYRNRIARILPVFSLYIAVLTVLARHYHYGIDSNDIWYSVFFLHTYFGDKSIWDQANLPLSHLWSLNVEEHCYILLSGLSLLLLVIRERFVPAVMTGIAFLSVAFFELYKIFPPESLSPAILRTECAGFSILISAAILLWLDTLRIHIPGYVPVIALVSGLGTGALAQHEFTLFVISPFLLAVSINTLYAAPAWFRMILSTRALMWFGICSYSIYIWQQLFFYLVEFHPPYIRCLGLVMAFVIGVISFYFYEKPTRRWIREIRTEGYDHSKSGSLLLGRAEAV